MDYLKDTVFKTMKHIHNVREGQLDRDIARLEKELEETAASLAKLKNEQENNSEAVIEACEMFGFVIGGYKGSSILDYGRSALFYDQSAADQASRTTELDLRVSAYELGNSAAKMLFEEGRLPSE
ncbi:hypothetical protein [Bacillus phage phiAGATE]|uniref:Uncharacterized protein n=1 Tax=Bacillus phage phiAGATE TaxID=1204533 RepID=L0LA91_9CAUD|nr:hypothetical protein G380_gp166 [Bacillus phage phiAGATE]AGB62612.1 hypothetical protein [Bacillus phage phiAGATE]